MQQQLQRDTVLGKQEQMPSSERRSSIVQKSASFIKEFEWKIEQFCEEDALKKFSVLADENINLEGSSSSSNKISIAETSIKSSGFSKITKFIIRGFDHDNQNIQIVRKYSDFYELREALLRRWPGCFIPPIPEIGNIGITQKQINRNKTELINNFLKLLSQNEHIYGGEQFQTFLKSPQNNVAQNLSKIKPRPYHQLLNQYKQIWPEHFREFSEEQLKNFEDRIKKTQDFFAQMKYDLTHQKNQMKRLAELRTKLDQQRFNMLEKLLPEYQNICLDWFNGPQQGQEKDLGVYNSEKYKNVLEGYKEYILPEENVIWSLYEMFKFEQKEIDCLLQVINQYRFMIKDRKFYVRNIENNTQQLEDINNNKISFKILMLSGSEDDKKSQLANQTEGYEKSLKMLDQLYSGISSLIIQQIEDFQHARCEFYKKKMIGAFKNQAIFMGKLFNLYVQTQRI